jgi:DNA-binding transcriptional LysR family regulator
MNLRTFNLNLLIVFEAMMAERNTTKAGEQLGLSQSAVSNSLAQLRVLFSDPLFVRIRNEMVPTARAMELIGPVSDALAQMQKVIAPPEAYDVTESKRTFRIGMTDYTAFVMLSGILARIRDASQSIRISVQNINASQIHSSLENDDVDICVGSPSETNDAHLVELLFNDDWVCARHADGRNRPMTMEDYLAASHVVVGKSLSNHVDRALAKVGASRTNIISIPFCLAAPIVVEQSDVYLTLPRRLAVEFSRGRDVEIRELPFATQGFSVSMVHHSRFTNDPGLKWLRQIISASDHKLAIPAAA